MDDAKRNGASAAQAWLGAAAFAVAVATPFLAYVANLGLAGLVALAGLACLASLRPPRTWPWGLWVLIGLLAWALASYAWSPLAPDLHNPKTFRRLDTITGLKLMLELGLYTSFIAAMGRLRERTSARVLTTLGVGLGLLAVVLIFEALTNVLIYRAARDAVGLHAREDLPIHHIARGCYVAVVLFWPTAFGLVRRGWAWAAAGLWVLTLAACLLLHVDSPTVALIVSTAAILLVRLVGRVAVWTCGGLLAAYLILAPAVFALVTSRLHAGEVSAVGKASWGARTTLWRFTAGAIGRRPLFGWGLDASRAWPGRIPLHPHDAALQIWLELGAVGAILAMAFVVWLFARLAKLAETDRPLAAVSIACVAAYAVIGALSFGVWQEWWLATGAVAAAACLWLARGSLVATAAAAAPPPAETAPDSGEVAPYFS